MRRGGAGGGGEQQCHNTPTITITTIITITPATTYMSWASQAAY